jgi:hypothetical protein
MPSLEEGEVVAIQDKVYYHIYSFGRHGSS